MQPVWDGYIARSQARRSRRTTSSTTPSRTTVAHAPNPLLDAHRRRCPSCWPSPPTCAASPSWTARVGRRADHRRGVDLPVLLEHPARRPRPRPRRRADDVPVARRAGRRARSSGLPEHHALVATIFLGVPAPAGHEAAAGAGRVVRHGRPLRRPAAHAPDRQARRAATAATTPPSNAVHRRAGRRSNPAPPTSPRRGTRRPRRCRAAAGASNASSSTASRREQPAGHGQARPASPAPGPAPRTAGRTARRRTPRGPTRRTWPGRQRRRRRCVPVAAAIIAADRSTPVYEPDVSRSSTSVAATPWPHPTSTTRSAGCGSSRSTTTSWRVGSRVPREGLAGMRYSDGTPYSGGPWPTGRGGRTCARRRRRPPAARRRRSGHPCRARSTRGCR